MVEFTRYARQTLVAQIGFAGQQTLNQSKVLIVGAGGLGCQVGVHLAGAGVGELLLVDHDTIELSNLHRQILFTEADVGQAKAETACAALQARNADIKIKAINKRLAIDNVAELVGMVDLVIDAADNFATSYLLSDACQAQGAPLLSASVNRTFGYLGVFCGGDGKAAPSMRAVFPRLPQQSRSCDTVGVTGPAVGVIASLQAQEAIKILLDADDQLLGKLLYCDLWNYAQHSVDFSNAIEPQESQIQLLSKASLDPLDYVVDVRNQDEVRTLPQPFATHVHLPLADLIAKTSSEKLAPPDQTTRMVLACQSGQRALIGAQILLDRGYPKVAALLPDSE